MLSLYLFIFVFVWRLLTYIFRILRCNWAYNMYLENNDKNTISRLKPILEDIFTECNCKFVDISILMSNKERMIDCFETSIGCYLSKIVMNFYPNYWLKKIFKDPFLELAKASGKKVIEKLLWLILHAFCWLVGTIDFASVLSEEVLNTLEIIKRLISIIFK